MSLGKMSFIMPAYDIAWRVIDRAIESILDQDYKDWELIVVQNGTADKGKIKEVVTPFLKDSRITLLEFEQSGACFARNRGAEKATGDFYSFFSSDFVLKPGMLRMWLERFRDNKDFGMVYGGYAWTDEAHPVYHSQEFDEYILTRGYNFIDGGFPIRKEYYLPWDENLKSLNDWEWVINLVEHGCKPLYISDIAYAADLPKAGGLSNDSAKNWKERVSYIRKKHNIPESNIAVSSLGAPMHGIRTAKLLNADFKQYPNAKPNDYDVIYLLGFYVSNPSSVQAHAQIFDGTRGRNVKKVIHWIGSDISGMMGMSWGANRNLVDAFNREGFIHLCEMGSTKAELEAMGLKAHILPLPMDCDKYKITPLPKTPTVAVYFPEHNQNCEQTYNITAMKDIAESMPDVQFKFFGGAREGKEGNVQYTGYIDPEKMPEFIKECSAIVRITWHDGLPISVLEFVLSGREAIVSVPNLSGTYYAGHGKLDENNYSSKKEEIISHIRSALEKPSSAKEKLEISKYWRDRLNPRKFREVFEDIRRGKYDA